MQMRLHARSVSARAPGLLVLLQGAGDRLGCFAEHGLVELALDSTLDVDVLELDAHFGYYRSLTLVERLEQDVLRPCRERYRDIWLVGVSMGGLGALLTASAQPELVDGVVLISPYLGRRRLIREIDEGGGLATWEAPADAALWRWDLETWKVLQRLCLAPQSGDPELLLLHADEDLSPRAHQLVAAALPSERVITLPGQHDWKAWAELFGAACAGPLASRLAPVYAKPALSRTGHRRRSSAP